MRDTVIHKLIDLGKKDKDIELIDTIEDGIDINDFRISSDEGLEVKKTIPSPLIDVDESIIDETLENVHHIDFHSAYMSGIAVNYPALKAPIEYIYNRRKD